MRWLESLHDADAASTASIGTGSTDIGSTATGTASTGRKRMTMTIIGLTRMIVIGDKLAGSKGKLRVVEEDRRSRSRDSYQQGLPK